MKLSLVVLNLVIILCVNADVTTDLGPVDLSSSIGKVRPLYNPLQPDDLKATKNAKEYVEELRAKFPTGFAYIPPLDPFQKPSLQPIPIEKDIVKGYLVISNLRIDGAKEFVVKTTEVRMSIDTVNAVISVPKIVGNVDFDAEVVVGILPLTISGHLRSTLTGINVVGVFGSTETPMNDMEVYQVIADDLKITADNLQVTLSDMSINVDKAAVKLWWGKLKNDIVNVANTAVIQEINEVLKHYTSQQIRDLLLAP